MSSVGVMDRGRCIATGLALLAACGLPQDADAVPHLTGARASTTNTPTVAGVSVRRVTAPRAGPRTLPSRVKLLQYLPTVRAQGLNNCGAFAPSYYYKTYQEAREHGWLRPDPDLDPQHVMSPGFTFPLTNAGQNNGANVAYVMAVICRYGIASWQDMPESVNYAAYPRESQWRAAMPYRGAQVLSFDISTDLGLQAVKQHQADGDPVVATLFLYHDVYDSYPSGAGTDNAVIYAGGAASSAWDWHAFTLIGYDDSRTYFDGTQTRSGAFYGVNSWGPSWGVSDADVGTAGFVWFGYDYLRNGCGPAGAGASLQTAGINAMDDRIDYQPTDVLVVDLEHSYRAGLGVQVKPGRRDDASWSWLDVFPNAGSEQPFNGRIVADITDFAADHPLAYWLRINSALGHGVVTGLEIQKANGALVFAPDPDALPHAIPERSSEPSSVTTYLSAGAFVRMEQPAFSNGYDWASAAWADVDNDGDQDLAVCGLRKDLAQPLARLYVNQGGLMVEHDAGLPAVDAGELAWADYDLDGYSDLALVGSTSTGLVFAVMHNNGDGTFIDSGFTMDPPGYGPHLAWGDYDGDGDPDLIVAGKLGTTLYRNDRSAMTSTATFSPAQNQPLAWVDFDNDGRLDLTIGSVVKHNDGNGHFSDAALMNSGWHGALAWGDYNGDGAVDLATLYKEESGSSRPCSMHVYRNGSVYYSPAIEIPGYSKPDTYGLRLIEDTPSTNLPNVYLGGLAWGDVDLDGKLDLALCGTMDIYQEVNITDVLTRRADGTFAAAGLDMTGVADGTVGWVDVDGDGDLDLFAIGAEDGSLVHDVSMALYENCLRQGFPPAGVPNHKPTVPTGLHAVPGNGATVRLGWNAATDVESAPSALRYCVRAGQYAGDCDLMDNHPAGMIVTDPYQQYVWAPRTNGLPGLVMTNLPPGRYQWKVQAVDGSGQYSDWSAAEALSVSSAGLRTGDVNGDGLVDAADVVRCRRMSDGMTTPDLTRADMDADGRVTRGDADIVMGRLLEPDARGYLPVTRATIGPAGGVLIAHGFALTFPPGALSETVDLELSRSQIERPFGAESPPTFYRLRGLPETLNAPLTVQVPATEAPNPNTTPLLFLGSPALPLPYSDGVAPRPAFRGIEGALAGGKATFTINSDTAGAVATAGAAAAKSAIGLDDEDKWSLTETTYWGWDLTAWTLLKASGAHFRIYYIQPLVIPDQQTKRDRIVALFDSLEGAYRLFNTSWGLHRLGDKHWEKSPLPIWVVPSSGSNEGDSSQSDMLLGEHMLAKPDLLNTTVAHELLHIVQSMYGFTYYGSRTLWLAEALSTWTESRVSSDPGYLPPNFIGDNNRTAAFRGLQSAEMTYGEAASQAWGNKTGQSRVANHGYGLAGLIQHLCTNAGTGLVSSVCESIAAKKSPVEALDAALPSTPATDWHASYFDEWAQGNLFPDPDDFTFLCQCVPKKQCAMIQTTDVLARANPTRTGTFKADMFGMGAQVFQFMFDTNQPLSNLDMLAMRVSKGADLRLSLLSCERREHTDAVVRGTANEDAETCRAVIGNLEAIQSNKRMIFAIASNNDVANAGKQSQIELAYGMVRDWDGPLSETLQVTTDHPHLSVAHQITFNHDMAYVTNWDFNGQWGVDVEVWKDGTLPFAVSCVPVPTETTWTETDGGGNEWHYTLNSFKYLEIMEESLPVQGQPTTILRTFTAQNSFLATVPDYNEKGTCYDVKACYAATAECPGWETRQVDCNVIVAMYLLYRK